MAEPQDLVTAARCFDCVPSGIQRSVLLYVFNQIRILQGGSVMTVQELMAASKCYSCIPKGLEGAALLYLAQAFVDSGGIGSNNISGAGSPVGVVTPDALNQFYRDTTGTALWQSNGLTSADWINWA